MTRFRLSMLVKRTYTKYKSFKGKLPETGITTNSTTASTKMRTKDAKVASTPTSHRPQNSRLKPDPAENRSSPIIRYGLAYLLIRRVFSEPETSVPVTNDNDNNGNDAAVVDDRGEANVVETSNNNTDANKDDDD